MPKPIVPISRLMTLGAYFTLLLFLLFAIITKKIYPEQPEVILLFALVAPMLFPLRGLLQAKRYTHAWASFLFLYYIVAGTDIWARGQMGAGSIILLLTAILFTGCILYARYSPLPFHGFDSKQPQSPKGKEK